MYATPYKSRVILCHSDLKSIRARRILTSYLGEARMRDFMRLGKLIEKRFVDGQELAGLPDKFERFYGPALRSK